MASLRTVRGPLTFLALVLMASVGAGKPVEQAPDQHYSVTIFVVEGIPTGHVFVRLAGGGEDLVVGFYPKEKSIRAPFGGEGGEIRLDGHITNWTVKKEYPIT